MRKPIPLIFLIFTLLYPGCCPCSRTQNEPRETAGPNKPALVVSFHELAQKAGYRILNAGGNAFDAYVAVTLVENVISPGYVTLCGLLSTLIYHAEAGEMLYLDSGYNSVMDPEGAYETDKPVAGKKIVVPGLVAGLESISQRFGKLNFSETLQPAIEIARQGFAIDETFSQYISYEAEKLGATPYGRKTFFREGQPLKPGAILKQPELADFLSGLARHGAGYMYTKIWAERFVRLVRERGGLMTMADMIAYQPLWTQPWKLSYRDFDLYASSGRANLSLWVLLALKTLEHTDIRPKEHFSVSADRLETMVRVARAVEEEKWIHNHNHLDDRDLVNSRLTLNYSAGIWARANRVARSLEQNDPQVDQTLSSIIRDSSGNTLCGKHSINSELWGDGLFIQGVLVNASGDDIGRHTAPGQRRIQGAPNFLIFKARELRYACGTWSSSNPQAAFQILVNLMDYRISADQAVNLPRFGSFPVDAKTWSFDSSKNWLDRQVSPEIVEALKKRGLEFSQEKPKLGKACVAEFLPDGQTIVGWDKID